MATYWAIGRHILGRQGTEGWGAKFTTRLSQDLQERLPESKGFSARNLMFIRALAATWSEQAIVKAPLSQLPWYHHIALIQKLDDPEARLWYAAAALEHGWSRNVLMHHIETRRGVSERNRRSPTLT